MGWTFSQREMHFCAEDCGDWELVKDPFSRLLNLPNLMGHWYLGRKIFGLLGMCSHCTALYKMRAYQIKVFICKNLLSFSKKYISIKRYLSFYFTHLNATQSQSTREKRLPGIFAGKNPREYNISKDNIFLVHHHHHKLYKLK